MANKIDNAVDAIVTRLNSVHGPGGTDAIFKKGVARKIILAHRVSSRPVMGIVVDDFWREGGTTWIVNLLLMLVDDADMFEDVAKITATLKALAAEDGTLPANMDRPKWHAWHDLATPAGSPKKTGALGSLRIRVQEPFLIT